ncbi:MAG: hypothetical protein H3C62_11665 [Gemmatimonadaceae bacterium]|nr:hypothetical protein [Gemmatimonadaceae bacterium]
MPHRVSVVVWLLLPIVAAPALRAQTPGDSTITVAPTFGADRFVSARESIALTLSRVPAGSEGRIAVFVGTSDLTSLFERDGSRLVFRANGVELPSGESEVKVYLVAGTNWSELSRLPLRVLTPRGFEQATLKPTVELRNTGQVAEGVSGTASASARPTYQILGSTIGLETSHVRDGYRLTSSTHLLGANERPNALRFGELGDKASRVDLADYAIRLESKHVALSLGQVTAGMNRHLINGFASRGVTAVVGGSRLSWSVGLENGTSIVGTDNITGLDDSNHRVLASGLSYEVLAARPGALHLDATVLHGSLRAASGFTQSGVIAADQSDGYGVQIAASSPLQRLKFSAGLASSSSKYAADATINSGGSIVPSRAHRKAAQYAELSAGLLQDRRVFRTIPVTMNMSVRHERVEPLYRSVGAYVQSDIERNAVDVVGNVDVLSVQGSYARTGDNLDRIASLLTTRSRLSTLTMGAPLAALLRVTQHATLLPTLSYALQGMHQFGAGIPSGGLYTASDIPDQMNVVHDVGVQWQVKQWQVGYRLNASRQDNRAPGHGGEDLAAQTHAITVAGAVGATLTLGLDLGLERQENKQFSQVSHVRRAGLTGTWRVKPLTTLDGALSLSRTEDPGGGSNTHVSSLQAGIAQGIRLWHAADGSPRGQAFLRFARYSTELINLSNSFAPPSQQSGTWTVSSGLSLRLF